MAVNEAKVAAAVVAVGWHFQPRLQLWFRVRLGPVNRVVHAKVAIVDAVLVLVEEGKRTRRGDDGAEPSFKTWDLFGIRMHSLAGEVAAQPAAQRVAADTQGGCGSASRERLVARTMIHAFRGCVRVKDGRPDIRQGSVPLGIAQHPGRRDAALDQAPDITGFVWHQTIVVVVSVVQPR